MMSSIALAIANRLRGRRGASLSASILFVLLSGYGVTLYFDYDYYRDDGLQPQLQMQQLRQLGSRSLQVADDADAADAAIIVADVEEEEEYDPEIDPIPGEEDESPSSPSPPRSRKLARSGDSPDSLDSVPQQYIVKPWIGQAQTDIYETLEETKLLLSSAQASTTRNKSFIPAYAIDDPSLVTRWASGSNRGDLIEWLQIDLGGATTVSSVFMNWMYYAVDYNIQVAFERQNCRSNGDPCPDSWITVGRIRGKDNVGDTFDYVQDAPQGVRYLRVLLLKRQPGQEFFAIYYIRVYRKKMLIGQEPSGPMCGTDTTQIAYALADKYKMREHQILEVYQEAEFFMADMLPRHATPMLEDPCVFAVEPNYYVRARESRGSSFTSVPYYNNNEQNGEVGAAGHRRLAIPEFNLRDENPPNWGLERISSHGALNGQYVWFGEGSRTHIYMFDTGIYKFHSEWDTRDPEIKRLELPKVCIGTRDDFKKTDHGTHLASLAAGFTNGVGRDATIHPMQVLGIDGVGTLGSFMCGVERVIADAVAYNTANAPKKYQAVVNLSLGVHGRSDIMDKAVYRMIENGIAVVIAAGNDNNNACFFSPYDVQAITVGALANAQDGKNDKTADSNYGECVNFWAPGEDIAGASNKGEYESVVKSGTSVAAAFVAGAASLFYEEINTEEHEAEELMSVIQYRMNNKAEINILREIGHASVNKVVQTTAVRCLENSHCQAGLTCLRDGMCVDLSKPLKGRNIHLD